MVHDHATTSSTFITRQQYFDIGTVNDTYTLYINKGNLHNYGKKLIRVLGPLIWNNIPYEIQDSTSIQTFKRNFKDYLIQKYYRQLFVRKLFYLFIVIANWEKMKKTLKKIYFLIFHSKQSMLVPRST